MKLTKITLAALVGVVSVVGGLGVGLGIGAGIWNKTNKISKLPVILVTDGGVINDKSFNQQAYEALPEIYKDYNVPSTLSNVQKYIRPNSHGASDISSAYAIAKLTLADDGIILAPGFYHKGAIDTFQKMDPNSKTKFILLDGEPKFGDHNLKNTIGIEFDTKTAAFKAGYLSGLYLQYMGDDTPVVGLWGGGNFPGVTDFMIGYVAGIRYYNDNNGTATDVKFAVFAKKEDFTNSGFDQGNGGAKANTLLNNGADIILPVAGSQTIDALSSLNKRSIADKARIKIIGVDNDQAPLFPGNSNKFLTSIIKNVKKASIEGVKKATGKKNDLGSPMGKYDPSSLYFKVGTGGFTGYAHSKEGTIKDSHTWKEAYDKIAELSLDKIENVMVKDKKLNDADWDDAYAYIDDHK